MLKIGITGGIGSGKSTVAKIFEILGIPVYYADEAARRLMNEDPELKQSIMKHFGPQTYVDGKLNRPYLSNLVFGNKESIGLLNSLVHPVTINDGVKWMLQQTTPYALKEAALIFEAGIDQTLDYVIGISCPEALRIERTIRRSGISREEVKKRMGNQMAEDEKMKRSDFVIYNDETQAVLPQVLSLHQHLLVLAARK